MAESALAAITKLGEVEECVHFPGIRFGTVETSAHLSEIRFGKVARCAHLPDVSFGAVAKSVQKPEVGLNCVVESAQAIRQSPPLNWRRKALKSPPLCERGEFLSKTHVIVNKRVELGRSFSE